MFMSETKDMSKLVPQNAHLVDVCLVVLSGVDDQESVIDRVIRKKRPGDDAISNVFVHNQENDRSFPITAYWESRSARSAIQLLSVFELDVAGVGPIFAGRVHIVDYQV